MPSIMRALVMNLTALFCVRRSDSKFVLATVCVGTDGYIRVVYSLSLFLVLMFSNLFSLVRFVLAIAYRMFIWLCIPT